MEGRHPAADRLRKRRQTATSTRLHRGFRVLEGPAGVVADQRRPPLRFRADSQVRALKSLFAREDRGRAARATGPPWCTATTASLDSDSA